MSSESRKAETCSILAEICTKSSFQTTFIQNLNIWLSFNVTVANKTSSIRANFENLAKEKEQEDRRKAEAERAQRMAREKQEQEEARRKLEVSRIQIPFEQRGLCVSVQCWKKKESFKQRYFPFSSQNLKFFVFPVFVPVLYLFATLAIYQHAPYVYQISDGVMGEHLIYMFLLGLSQNI